MKRRRQGGFSLLPITALALVLFASSGGITDSKSVGFVPQGRRAEPGGRKPTAERLGKKHWVQQGENAVLRHPRSAHRSMAATVPDGQAPSSLPLLPRLILASGGVVAGLVVLLYVTSFFERIMHSTSGLIRGNSRLVAAATGLMVGGLHTVAGPDHLAGLAPMVVGQGHTTTAAFGLGALWGSGHATGQLIIGLVCLLVQAGLLRTASRWTASLGQASGLIVGIALVLIGLLGFSEARSFQDDGMPEEMSVKKKRRFTWATYATGVLHGLSPDAVIFIAPALALPRVAAACHVVGVVIGTLLAMGICTAALSALCRRSPRLRLISRGASSVAVLLGLCISAASFGFSVPLPGL